MNQKRDLEQKKQDFISWTVFLFTITVVIITLISVIFPAFIMGINDDIPKYPTKINIYELGILAYPLLITNVVIVGLVILNLKNKLPWYLIKSIRSVLNFEVSIKIAFLVVAVLIGLYITFTVAEISQGEPWEDYTRTVKPKLETWTFDEFFNLNTSKPITYFFETMSMNIFGNYKVIPFVASIALLVLTYFITAKITEKKLAGLISLVLVLSSTIFLTYDTSITYPNFWILFYLLSLFTIYKIWPLSPLFFVLAVASKPLPILFLPMTLFFVYRSSISRKKKLLITISYVVILVVGVTILSFYDSIPFYTITFDNHEFWSGFTTISSQFRFDGIILIFLLPLVVGLFMLSRKGIKDADSVMVLILGILLLAPFISGFLTYTNNPYRFIPLIIFFAMGIGILFSKRINQLPSVRSNEL